MFGIHMHIAYDKKGALPFNVIESLHPLPYLDRFGVRPPHRKKLVDCQVSNFETSPGVAPANTSRFSIPATWDD